MWHKLQQKFSDYLAISKVILTYGIRQIQHLFIILIALENVLRVVQNADTAEMLFIGAKCSLEIKCIY